MAVHFSLSQNMKNLGRYLKRARFVVLPNPYGQTGILRARFNDAVFVSLKHRYLFTSNEKVANSTLRATFQNLECDGKLPPHYKQFKRWTGPLLQPSDVPDFAGILSDPSVRKFCVVRHPYTRLISCYRDKLESRTDASYRRKMRELGFFPSRRISFAEFLHAISKQHQTEMNSHWRIQYHNVFMDIIRYDEIIRYEELNSRLSGLVAELYPDKGRASTAILLRNRKPESSEGLLDAYFTPELRTLAAQIYRPDFEAFDYKP